MHWPTERLESGDYESTLNYYVKVSPQFNLRLYATRTGIYPDYREGCDRCTSSVSWKRFWHQCFCSNNYFPPNILEPNIKTKINNTKKMKNKILAIEAAPAAMPVKPKIAAIIAITKNMAAHLSIHKSFIG